MTRLPHKLKEGLTRVIDRDKVLQIFFGPMPNPRP
jgi:hypothetical protein